MSHHVNSFLVLHLFPKVAAVVVATQREGKDESETKANLLQLVLGRGSITAEVSRSPPSPHGDEHYECTRERDGHDRRLQFLRRAGRQQAVPRAACELRLL